MTAQLIKREIWLADIIYRSEGISLAEINRKWLQSSLNYNRKDLPIRTFHKHKKKIEELFDIVVSCDIKDTYKYYIEDSIDMHEEGVKTWMLKTFFINNSLSESKSLRGRIELENIPSGQQFLTEIVSAILDSNIIRIAYQGYWNDEPNTFEVSPYFIKLFKQRWYLVAYNDYRNKLMIYALDRIQNIIITKDKFEYPENLSSKQYFENYYEIVVYDDTESCIVKVKTTSQQANYIHNFPLHISQKEIERQTDYSIFEYYIKPTYDFQQELLSMGSSVEILGPIKPREDIADIIKEMNKLYNN